MAMVVTQPCIGCKDKACLPVCPADCFHEDETMVFINPDECIDCGACIPECPTEAIFHEEEVPQQWKEFVELNRSKAEVCPSAHT